MCLSSGVFLVFSIKISSFYSHIYLWFYNVLDIFLYLFWDFITSLHPAVSSQPSSLSFSHCLSYTLSELISVFPFSSVLVASIHISCSVVFILLICPAEACPKPGCKELRGRGKNLAKYNLGSAGPADRHNEGPCLGYRYCYLTEIRWLVKEYGNKSLMKNSTVLPGLRLIQGPAPRIS